MIYGWLVRYKTGIFWFTHTHTHTHTHAHTHTHTHIHTHIYTLLHIHCITGKKVHSGHQVVRKVIISMQGNKNLMVAAIYNFYAG